MQDMTKQGKSLSPSSTVLARWWFVHPLKAALFDKFVKEELGVAEGLSRLEPDPKYDGAMFAFGVEHAVDGRSSVLSILQGAGDIVQIPPGRPHAVINLDSCCKLAWCYYDMSQIANYLMVHRDIASPLFQGKEIAEDYMSVSRILNAAVVRFCRQAR